MQHAAVRAASEAAPATHTIPTGKPATTSQGTRESINRTDGPPGRPRTPAQAAQHAAVPEAAPAAHTIPNPAIVSQAAPISISPGDRPSPWPPHITMLAVKPLRTKNVTTTNEPVPESSLRGSIDSLIPAAPAPQTMPLPRISTQATQPAPAANTEQPDSSVTSVETQEAAAIPSGVRTETVQPSGDTILPDDERAGQGDASTTNTIGTMTFLAPTTPPEMFPILALALLIAGLLFRVVIRVAAAHSERRIVINRESDLIDGRNELIDDDLLPSANNQWPDNSCRPDHAPDIKDQIRKRQDMLEELKRNLDRMLQSPTVV